MTELNMQSAKRFKELDIPILVIRDIDLLSLKFAQSLVTLNENHKPDYVIESRVIMQKTKAKKPKLLRGFKKKLPIADRITSMWKAFSSTEEVYHEFREFWLYENFQMGLEKTINKVFEIKNEFREIPESEKVIAGYKVYQELQNEFELKEFFETL